MTRYFGIETYIDDWDEEVEIEDYEVDGMSKEEAKIYIESRIKEHILANIQWRYMERL